MSFGYDLHDRKPEAAAGVASGVAAPPEAFEELLRVLVAEPYSGVLYDEDRPLLFAGEGDGDPGAAASVIYAVG